MAHYFASDVHLRFDQPDQDRRFRAWLSGLTPEDSLVIAGDLCDFWMAARLGERDLLRSESLRALASFRRRGGALAIMPGNHDAWLCPFYENALGALVISEPYDLTIHGLRFRVVHGHLLGRGGPGNTGLKARHSSARSAGPPAPSRRCSIISSPGTTNGSSLTTKRGT